MVISRLQHLPQLGLAWQFSREDVFARSGLTQVLDWLDHNPVGFGINWTCTMDVALRAVSLAWWWELIRNHPSVQLNERARVYASLLQHGRFVEQNLEDDGVVIGNHYVANLTGLIVLGGMLSRIPDGARWLRIGTERLVRHIPQQVNRDGSDFEASIPYHRLVLELVGLSLSVLRINGHPVPDALEYAATRMARFTRGILKPNGHAPQIGDNDGGRAFRLVRRDSNDHQYLPCWIGLLLGNSTMHTGLSLDPEALLLTGPNAERIHHELSLRAPPIPEVRHFEDAGIVAVSRGGAYVAISAGPVGQRGVGGHGHNDKLSVEVFLGADLVVDPGTYVYTADPKERNRFRGTAMHATAQVDGAEQNPVSLRDPFFLPERARARTTELERNGDVITWKGQHDGFAPCTHLRQVVVNLESRTVTLHDEIRGKGGGHEISLGFPLHPEVDARIIDGRVVMRKDGHHWTLEVESPRPIRIELEESWFSRVYGERTRTRLVRISSSEALLPTRFTTTIACTRLECV